MGLAAYVDWTRRPPAPLPCWLTDPWREGAPVDEIAAYEEAEAARLAPSFSGVAIDREVAIDGLFGHGRETSPARSATFAVVRELADRQQWQRGFRRRPLSAEAIALNRRLHRCGVSCWMNGCGYRSENTTPDVGTSHAENVNVMKR